MVNGTVYLSESKNKCERVKHALAFSHFIDGAIINAYRIKIRRMNCEKEQYGVIVYALDQKELDIIKGFVEGYRVGWNHLQYTNEKDSKKVLERI